MNDAFGSISPDINIIFPSFDIIGSLWRCILRPIFVPQTEESRWTKTDDFVAPKIIKTSTAFRQPLPILNASPNLVRLNTNLNSLASPSNIFIANRNGNTAGTFRHYIDYWRINLGFLWSQCLLTYKPLCCRQSGNKIHKL